MPTYDYRCDGCDEQVEDVRSIADESELLCSICGEPMKRIITTCNFVLKGGNWGGKDVSEKAERITRSKKMREKTLEKERFGQNT